MAKSDLQLTVSVEKAIHNALQEVLRDIWDKHQVCVRDISPEWVDRSTFGEQKMALTGLDMRTTTKV